METIFISYDAKTTVNILGFNDVEVHCCDNGATFWIDDKDTLICRWNGGEGHILLEGKDITVEDVEKTLIVASENSWQNVLSQQA